MKSLKSSYILDSLRRAGSKRAPPFAVSPARYPDTIPHRTSKCPMQDNSRCFPKVRLVGMNGEHTTRRSRSISGMLTLRGHVSPGQIYEELLSEMLIYTGRTSQAL